MKHLAATLLTMLLLASMTTAHHSFAAEYDGTKPVKVTGVVKRVEWQNPHIWFYVDGQDEVTGRAAVWGFSGAPPGMLLRRGITRDAIKVGDTVVVEGFLARDGSANASGGKVTFPDGRQVFTAAAEDRTPQ
jgi:hypothetical protein